MLEDVYILKVQYPDGNIEDVSGIVDYNKKIIRLIELSPDFPKGYKERGFINFQYVKKLWVVKIIGCIGDRNEECVS